ncbi:hypothetical protein MKEN_01409600 [Mycena kentingensis (nom. inval.)]|nr:hypothetical protein MKEN_01409600 [Mycena kentingensis (nom. inval.)]
MIVTDSTPKTPPKSTTPLLGEASGAAPPPAYAPRVAAPPPVPIASYQGYQPVAPSAYPQRPRQSAAKRFCKTLIVALGVWLLASALFGSFYSSRRLRDTQLYSTEYPIPSDVELDEPECVPSWTDGPRSRRSSHPFSAYTNFKFDLPPETLLLLSKGALSAGNLDIATHDGDDVEVKVVVHYDQAFVRDTVKACLITRKDGEAGVGIFTPQWWRRPGNRGLVFEIQLSLPRNSKGEKLINTLFTDVSNISQRVVEGLQDVVRFNSLELTGSNGRISAASLVANTTLLRTSNGGVQIGHLMATTAIVRSSNGGISGTYATKGPLELRTSNGAIDVSVAVTSDSSNKTPLTMVTSNGKLTAVVDLISPSASTPKDLTFPVTARTSNGALSVTIKELPLDAKLDLQARTSNTPATVGLPLTYEGSFSVKTSNSPSLVKRLGSSERDPACPKNEDCKARSRQVETRMIRKTAAEGVVYWDEKNKKRGVVTVTTSNSPLTLVL